MEEIKKSIKLKVIITSFTPTDYLLRKMSILCHILCDKIKPKYRSPSELSPHPRHLDALFKKKYV